MPPIRAALSLRWFLIAGAAFLAVLAAANLFAAPLAGLLNSDGAVRLDRAAWDAGRAYASPAVLAGMSLVSDLHGTVGILVLTALAAWGWQRNGQPGACVRLLLAVPTGMLLNVLVKLAVHRIRPDWAVVDLPRSASFPSGHVAESTVFYGALVLEAIARGLRPRWRLPLALAAVAMIALVAASRIFLGVHFMSDCVAAVIEGMLWLAACFQGRPLRSDTTTAAAR